MAKTIMHVDDDEDTRKVVKTMLEKGGYKVISLPSGKECLEYLQEEGLPDLILLDIMMPDVSGWNVATELRFKNKEKYRDIKLIFVTVVEIDGDIKKSLKDSGVNDYIIKPFTKDVLLKKVGSVLKS